MSKETIPQAKSIPLSEMVQSLREELQASMKQAQGESLRFQLEKVELDLQVEISWDVQADGGIRFGVLSIGASAGRTSGSTHTFKLTLLPVSSQGGDTLISGEASVRPE